MDKKCQELAGRTGKVNQLYIYIYIYIRDATCHTVPCPWLHEACSSYTCRVMERPCRARMRRAVPCQNVPCQRTCRARTCRAVPCHAVPCHAVPCHAMPCRGLQRTGCPTIKVVTPTKKVALPRKKVVTAPGSSYPPPYPLHPQML